MQRVAPESTAFLIAMIRRRLNLAFATAIRADGITTRQYGVLSRLWRKDGLTLDELVASLYSDQSSLSRVVERMVRAGLVERRVDPTDRRARRIHLTSRGRALESRTRRHEVALDRQLLRGVPVRESARLNRDLERLLANLQAPEGADEFEDDE